VDKLLAQAVDGIKAAKDSAQNVMFEYYQGYLYNGRGYGRPTGGDEVSLKNIKRAGIKKFYETYYTPGNTILAVVGDFNSGEMKKKLEAAFEGWTGKAAPAAKPWSPTPAKGRRLLLVDKPDSTQTFFVFGNLGVARNDPDRTAVRLINAVFGGRFTSMLNEALRVESGLTYGASSFFIREKEPGPFAIFSYTKNETTGQAIDMAVEVLKKLHTDGVTKEQLDSARSYIKGQFPPTIETSGQLAELIASNEFYGLDDSEVNELDARLDAVTPEVAKQVIAKHFPQEDLVFTLIGKSEEVGPAVKKFAETKDSRKISESGYWPGPAMPAVKK
jgi:zinc protease